MLNQEEITKILSHRGDVRGAVFKTDAEYIARLASAADLKKVEQKLKEWGVSLDYQVVMPMAWYPVAWRVLSLLAVREVLNWDDQAIREMGRNAPKASVIVKLFFKLFPDIGKFAQQIPHYWSKHYTEGSLEVISLDKEKREMVLHLNDFSFHPLLCQYLEGYFEAATKLTRPKESVATSQEIECSFRQQVPYEAFKLTWTQ